MSGNKIHLDSLTKKIIEHFSVHSSGMSTDIKWQLLKDYHSQFLCNFSISPNLLSSYYSITSALLDALKPTLFTDVKEEQSFDNIFISGIHHEAFGMLIRKLGTTVESYQQQKILNILQKFIQHSNIENLISYQCSGRSKSDSIYIALSQNWDELITFLVTLPERVANKTKGQMNKIFQTNFYIHLLSSSIWKVLVLQHDKIKNGKDTTLEFLGKLTGKLCLHGYSDVVVKKLSSELISSFEKDFLWSKISQNLISKLPLRSMEPFMTYVLATTPWYGYIYWFVGDEVMTNKNLCYMMSVKLILVRHFEKVLILQNIIGYFASANNRESEFLKIFASLLQVWCDESSMKHQSFEQQKYIASALIISSGWIEKRSMAPKVNGHLNKILHGTQIRIGNSCENIRLLGQIVGSSLISVVKPDGPVFEFEASSNEFLESMQNLKNVPHCPDKDYNICLQDLSCFDEVESEKIKWSDFNKRVSEMRLEDENIASESDDGLEPYDIPDETSEINVERPLYLMDCLQGLIEQEKPEWVEQCLIHAESLIERNSHMVQEVAVEMAKVLLHLDDKFNTTNFMELRLKTLKVILIHCPILVAGYLTEQFYERDFNIRQRLDILEVLASASKHLSTPKEAVQPTHIALSREKFDASVENDWKTIVEQRVASKTRHITKVKRKPETLMLQNQFSTVAGYFFFPLMEKYDRDIKILNLLGDDSYVLGRLIYTLGAIMKSAENIPLSSHMGKTLLEFLTDVRNNSDTFVRQSAIYAMAMVYTSVPGYLLYGDSMSADVLESQQWLHSVIENDPDTNCKIKASCALSLILKIMKEEIPLIAEMTE